MEIVKIGDSGPKVTVGSRLEDYWQDNPMNPYFKKVRPGLQKLPKGLMTNDAMEICRKFNLVGIGFGNWLTVEDRVNYLHSLTIALYDLNKVLHFNYDIGLGVLTITFGARGMGPAAAHYESWSKYINLTRYRDKFLGGKTSKAARFFATGGMGALAHEYGHFLDYNFGAHVIYRTKNSDYSLTGGRSVNTKRYWPNSGIPLQEAMDDLLEAIIWKVPNKTHSNYFNRLENSIQTTSKGEYWRRRNEIFARGFEAWVSYELRKAGINNRLLTENKYDDRVYLRPAEIEKLQPKFKRLIGLMRKALKAGAD